MDRNEAMEIAREAGLRFHTSGSPSVAIEFVNGMVSELERAFELVAAREREACESLAAPYHTTSGNGEDGCPSLCTVCQERRLIRDEIRARGTDGIKG